ncbi:MAG: hypothetical protein PHI19_01995 [Clostridia bacterium]|nr:hypothetical protein [Clostridia bacterium]
MNNMMSMLPFLMSAMGGNKSGQGGGMDMASMMQMFSAMGGGSPFGGQAQQPPQGGGMDMSAMMNMMNMMQGTNKPKTPPYQAASAPPPPNWNYGVDTRATDAIKPMLPPEVLHMFQQMLNKRA